MTNDRMANDQKMHYIGFCRICGTGPLGLRECGGCGEIVVMCDECDAVWTDGDFQAKPMLADAAGGLPCPYCDSALLDEPSRWAPQTKIDKVAWLLDALRKGELELASGAALKPPVKE
ncbi:MAG: hypothetical protein ACR2NM_11720 [Bythopirellula sp.]